MSSPAARRLVKVAALLVLGIVVQTTFGTDLRVHEVAPDFMVLLAVTGGFCGGPDAGALIGFGAGLLADLFLLGTPFGLSALALCLVGFAVGWTTSNFMHPRLVLAPLAAATGTMFGVFVFVALGYVLGQAQLVAPGKRWLLVLAVVEAAYAALFAVPATWLMSLALRGPRVPVSSMGEVPGVGPGEAAGRRHAMPAPRARRRRRARVKVR